MSNLQDRLFRLKENLIVQLGGVVPSRNPETNDDDRLYQLEEAIALRLAAIATGSTTGINATSLDSQDGGFYLDRANHTGANNADTLENQPGSYYLANSTALDGQSGSYYLNRANHTGTNDADTLQGQSQAFYLNRANHTGPIDANFLDGYGSGYFLDRSNHTGANDADTLESYPASYFAPLSAVAPLVGSVMFVAFPITGPLYVDSRGYRWFNPDGSSIGSASSGAGLASSICEELYKAIWLSPAYTISGGKGTSAGADWNDNKPLLIPDMRGRAVVMAGAGSALGVGDRFGASTQTLVAANHAPHTHDLNGSIIVYNNSATPTRNVAINFGTLNFHTLTNLSAAFTSSQGSGTPFSIEQESHALHELWALGV